MLKIAVVDDDAKDADVIKKYIERYGRENARTPGKEDREIGVTVFGSAEDFLAGVPSGFDAVFFDIDMPGMNGMDAAKLLRGQGGEGRNRRHHEKVRRGERGFCGRNAVCHPDELRL